MKDPNLNIKRSDLSRLIELMGYAGGHNAEVAAKKMVELGKKFQCMHRVVMIKPIASVRKKMGKAIGTSVKNAERFNFLLIGARNEVYGMSLDRQEIIEKGTRQYNEIMDVTKIAMKFCETFGFNQDIGFERFIDIGLDIMQRRYGLNRFKSLKDRIFETQVVTRDIKTDPNRNMTIRGAQLYYKKVFDQTKIEAGKNVPEKVFANFVYAAKECKELKGKIDDWIEAQFDRLSYMDALPEPIQMSGEGARQGYIKYMYDVKNKTVTDSVKFKPEISEQDKLHFGG